MNMVNIIKLSGMNENLNSLIQVCSTGERRVYGVNGNNGEPEFNFTGLLEEISCIDTLYRIGLNRTFPSFEGPEQVAGVEEFEMIRSRVLERQVFPFINCVRNGEGEIVFGSTGVVDHYAVIYKFEGHWELSYLTDEQAITLSSDLESAYGCISSVFVNSIYAMLVHHGFISGYNNSFDTPEALANFKDRLLSGTYTYIQLQTLENITSPEGELIVGVLCFGRGSEGYYRYVNIYYVDTIVADFIHDAIMGDTSRFDEYLNENIDSSSFSQEPGEQPGNQYRVLEGSLDSSLADSVINNALNQFTRTDIQGMLEEAGMSSEEALETMRRAAENVREPGVHLTMPLTLEGNEWNVVESHQSTVDEDDLRAEETENTEERKEVNPEFLIPENSDTFLIDESTSRFSDAVWYNKIQDTDVMIAGLGGIGSWVAFLLARMKPRSLIVIDPDTVEMVNMAGQLFGESEIGLAKTTAICGIMARYCNYYKYFSYTSAYTPYTHGSSDIMICGFDNMKARKEYFRSWYLRLSEKSEEDRKKCLFIDGRLNAEEFQILCIRGDHTYHMNKYSHDWLFSDHAAEEATCSYKQTSFCANMIASCIVNLFVNHIANQCDPIMERPLPFLTYYNAEIMQFKME